MDKLIDTLREAKTLADADPILRKLNANGPVRKLVEASILQRMNPNPASYEYGVSMLNEAIQYLDKKEEPATPESDGVEVKKDKFVQEEILPNNNSTTQSKGSEQSTQTTEPYSGEGKKEGDEDMTSAPSTTNQFTEALPSDLGGLHPDIAKQVGAKMPTIPPMNTGDQIKQTQYTISNYHETIVKPLLQHSKVQDAAIKKLSDKIRETEAKAGTYSLNIPALKENSPARVRETVSQTIPTNPMEIIAQSRNVNKDYDVNQARSEIRMMNNQMSNQ